MNVPEVKVLPIQPLIGKVAIVTASTNGIGFAIAKRLAQDGAKVVVSSRNQRNVDRAVEQLAKDGLYDNIVGVVCHAAKEEDRKKIFDEAIKLGGLDILISNAAVNPAISPFYNCNEKMWDKVLDVNVKASFLLAKTAVPLLRKRGGGRIIFLSSCAAYRSYPYLSLYAVSKTALCGLTQALALDLASDNITVNCVAPGLVITNFTKSIARRRSVEQLLDDVILKRTGTSEEIATVVSFLVSDDSSYITGETITVGGGIHSRL